MSSTLAFRLSRGVRQTIAPPIPKAYKWVLSYVPTKERPVIDMAQGSPGNPPPFFLLDALSSASLQSDNCKYGPNDGDLSLRESLTREMTFVYGEDADITSDDIAITAGSNMAFAATVMSLADAGDEVILPVPWYFNHQMTLSLLGITTVALPTLASDGFLPSPEMCAKLITPKTRAIALVTPNNPTGAIYPPSLIEAFSNLARENDIALIIDETYRDFVSADVPHKLFSPAVSEPWRTHFIHLFSFSKSYSIPGYRLGAIAASPLLIEQIRTVLDCLQICPPRAVQTAIAPLLEDLRPFVHETALALSARQALFRELLPSRWKLGSQGGYFAFVGHPFRGISSQDVSMRLAQEVGVITLPAAFFTSAIVNEDRWIRFSVANVDDETIRRVCERLRECESRFDWELDALKSR